jgi:hypothetical protein
MPEVTGRQVRKGLGADLKGLGGMSAPLPKVAPSTYEYMPWFGGSRCKFGNDGIMPLICPTGQAFFLKKRIA